MITSIRRFVLCLSWIRSQDLLHIVHGPQDPYIEGTLHRPLQILALVVFSDVDVAFAMSHCCILPSRASVPPSTSRMILLSELILTTGKWLCRCICMSLMTTALYILRLCSLFKLHHEWLLTPAPPPVKLLPDVFSRMADDPPPPPYIAAMMQ